MNLAVVQTVTPAVTAVALFAGAQFFTAWSARSQRAHDDAGAERGRVHEAREARRADRVEATAAFLELVDQITKKFTASMADHGNVPPADYEGHNNPPLRGPVGVRFELLATRRLAHEAERLWSALNDYFWDGSPALDALEDARLEFIDVAQTELSEDAGRNAEASPWSRNDAG